jgi:hypothetical protein
MDRLEIICLGLNGGQEWSQDPLQKSLLAIAIRCEIESLRSHCSASLPGIEMFMIQTTPVPV